MNVVWCYDIGSGVDACGAQRAWVTGDLELVSCRVCRLAIEGQLI